MIVKESKKISKIVDELMLYFLKKGHTSLKMSLDCKREEVIISFELEDVEQSILDKLKLHINQNRELEVEEYGWELMGESDCENELELIGLLLDEFNYEVEDRLYKLRFVRKNK